MILDASDALFGMVCCSHLPRFADYCVVRPTTLFWHHSVILLPEQYSRQGFVTLDVISLQASERCAKFSVSLEAEFLKSRARRAAQRAMCVTESESTAATSIATDTNSAASHRILRPELWSEEVSLLHTGSFCGNHQGSSYTPCEEAASHIKRRLPF
jgi:hypothetical protein